MAHANNQRSEATYRAALEVYTKSAAPYYHQIVTNNLERALAALAALEGHNGA